MSVLNICMFLNICFVFCCVQAYDCLSGQCNILKDCPEVIKEIQNGNRPHTCGFQGKEPMVCCSKEESTTTEFIKQTEKNIRISKKKCAEYGQSVYKLEQTPLIISESENSYLNKSTCPDIHFNLLIRGTNAHPKEYPHMALIGTNKGSEIEWHCTGTLISEQYVLTAAFCVRNYKTGTVFKVRLGELESTTSPNNNDFEVTQIILHPEYKYPNVYNNIALLKLKIHVQFTEYIRPACLPDHEQNTTKYYLTGWGPENKTLLRAVTEKMSYDNCRRTIGNNKLLPFGIRENTQICTLNTEFDLCLLDIGSPIQEFNKDVYCMFDIIGLKTLIYNNNCSSQLVLYTKIFDYIDWIETIVWL